MLVVSISDLIDAPTPKACYASDQFLHLPAGSSDIAELRDTLHFVSCFSLTTTSILPRSFCYDPPLIFLSPRRWRYPDLEILTKYNVVYWIYSSRQVLERLERQGLDHYWPIHCRRITGSDLELPTHHDTAHVDLANYHNWQWSLTEWAPRVWIQILLPEFSINWVYMLVLDEVISVSVERESEARALTRWPPSGVEADDSNKPAKNVRCRGCWVCYNLLTVKLWLVREIGIVICYRETNKWREIR